MNPDRKDIIIPTQRPHFDNLEIQSINTVLESRWTGSGQVTQELQRKIQAITHAEYIIAVQSGTAALHLALEASIELGIIKPGEKIIVPSQTFAATIQAIEMANLIPKFCDICRNTMNMDPKHLIQLIDHTTKIVMPVHYRGEVCNMESILKIAKDNNMLVIEDAAHALGSTYKGKPVGRLGDITCFSMDHIKNATAIETGVITTENPDVANSVYRMSNLGFEDGKIKSKGFRYHPTDFNSAVGVVQLDRLNQYREKKLQISRRYQDELQTIPQINLLDLNLEETTPFMYVVLIVDGQRDKLREYLRNKGIETLVRYDPNHTQPYFVEKHGQIELPITEETYSQLVVLPLFYEMTDEEQTHVIKNIKVFFEKEKR